MQQPIENRQFGGLVPVVDRKKVEEPYVVDGRNFFVDINGPVSGFARTWVFHRQIVEPRGWQSLPDGSGAGRFHFTGDAICTYDTLSRQLVPVYKHAARALFWPWSRAVVGGLTFYANKEVGVLVHDRLTGEWRDITANANMPTDPVGVTESAGRLIVLGTTAVAWSVIDAGENLAPSTATGAGFQLLSILRSNCVALQVLAYAGGFLVYTCSGVIRFEAVDAANPFRVRVFSTDHQALNPWAVTSFDDGNVRRHIVLTGRGLFATDGLQGFQTWEALMSEHLQLDLIPNIETATRNDMTFRLETNPEQSWLSISVSDDSRNAIYSRALVFFNGNWGEYSRSHTGLGEILLNAGSNRGIHYAACDTLGSVARFTFGDADRVYPVDDSWFVDYKGSAEIPPRNFPGLAGSTPTIFSTMVRIWHENLRGIINPGVYDRRFFVDRFVSPVTPADVSGDETPVEPGTPLSGTYRMRTAFAVQSSLLQTRLTPVVSVNSPLDAEILVGPYRLPQPNTIDHIAQLQEAVISMLDESLDDEFEDYLDDYPAEDVFDEWNVLVAEEDWGESAGDNTSYSIRWVGTLDGYSTWNTGQETQNVIPDLFAQTGRNRHVAGVCSGIYIYQKFTANNVGETFHLRLLRNTFVDAGQLF